MSTSLFRSRLAKEFDERTAKFHTSVAEDLRIFEEDLNCTTAHDIMLHEQGIIPGKELRMILRALEEMRERWRRGEVTVTPQYEDIHEYIETKVIEEIGIETGGMIHTGRSRNDQVVCDVKMRLRDYILDLSNATLALAEAMQRRAGENADAIMILYTHGQHAQVGTIGAYLSSWADILLRDEHRLADLYPRVNTNPLGAGPVGGTSIKIDRKRTTELLGFDGVQENSIDATSSRDWAVEAAWCCASIMGDLSRVAADLLEWSGVEYGYVELADEYASSSSIMPQKKNPSTLELLRGKTGESYSGVVELLTMEKGVPTGYYADLQETKLTLWRTIDNALACLEILTGIISTMKVKPDRLARQTVGSFTMAVELAETLTNEAGLSFRESYKIAADLVNLVIERGQTLDKLTPSDIEASAMKLYKKSVKVNGSLIERATDPRQALLRRASLGSPRPDEVRRMVKEHGAELVKQKLKAEERRVYLEKALSNLAATAARYSA